MLYVPSEMSAPYHGIAKLLYKCASELKSKFQARDDYGTNPDVKGALSLQLYAALCVLSVLPFILINYPPIVDYPNHLARLSLACGISNPTVSAMYMYRIDVIPNLALDLFNLPLCGLISPEAVIKGTIAAALTVVYGSGWVIQRKLFGKPNAFLLMLPAVSFNLVTLMGYVNFLVGVALACAMVALALGRERNFGKLLLIGNLCGVLLFFSHVFALMLAMIFFLGWRLRGTSFRPQAVMQAGLETAAMFALPLLLLPLVASSGEPLTVDYAGKYRTAIMPFLSQRHNAEFALIALGLILPLYFGLRSLRIAAHPSFRLPLGLLGAYILLIPSHIQDAVDIDSRTLVAFAYLAFPALTPLVDSRRVTAWVSALALLLIAVHLTVAVVTWVPFSRQVQELRASLDVLPRHASLISVTEEHGNGQVVSLLAYSHLASYATRDRWVFNPLEFTGVGMQPLAAREPFAAMDTPSALPFVPKVALRLKDPDADVVEKATRMNAAFALRWQQRFDYVLYYHFGTKQNFDPATLVPVRHGSFFSILKVKRPETVRGQQNARP